MCLASVPVVGPAQGILQHPQACCSQPQLSATPALLTTLGTDTGLPGTAVWASQGSRGGLAFLGCHRVVHTSSGLSGLPGSSSQAGPSPFPAAAQDHFSGCPSLSFRVMGMLQLLLPHLRET